MLSGILKKNGIKHNVLNAKYHEKEAEIIAQAGKYGAVTISTNMAGRGTDIKLGEGVKEVGGLKIIGTERHESRRIDNQLRGRAGRQGDPGESRFFISLEDDLMRLFGSERLMGMFNSLGLPEGEQIEHKMLSGAIEKAQKRIENNNFGIRKNLLEYDQVNNDQREIIYEERRRVLDGESMRDVIYKMITDTVEKAVNSSISEDQSPEDWDLEDLNNRLLPIVPLDEITLDEVKGLKKNALMQKLKEDAVKLYEAKEAEFPEKEQLREIQAYGQRDPLVEYKFMGFEMFDEMTEAISEDTVKALLHIRIEQKVEREQVAKVTGTNKDDSVQQGPVRRVGKKIQPNDPCPCGSGKKYKYCCGRNA